MKKIKFMLKYTLITGFLLTLSPSLFASDAEAGEIKATTCLGCHGIANYNNVNPVYKVPKIGGQNEKYLVAALKAYKSGDRTHGTMQAQASSMSDEDIADISAWFASQ